MFRSHYTVYCKMCSNRPVPPARSFQIFQWYCDCFPTCTTHLKLRHPLFTLFKFEVLQFLPKCQLYASGISFSILGEIQHFILIHPYSTLRCTWSDYDETIPSYNQTCHTYINMTGPRIAQFWWDLSMKIRPYMTRIRVHPLQLAIQHTCSCTISVATK